MLADVVLDSLARYSISTLDFGKIEIEFCKLERANVGHGHVKAQISESNVDCGPYCEF